jgi:UDP-GlcNAc:undecaprenyl-phosphate GlcNAc-1-phosphate transferase
MKSIALLFAFALTAALIVLLRPLAIAIGLVDVPSGRKSHQGNIPLIGGMAIFLAALIVHYIFVWLTPGQEIFKHTEFAAFFIAGAILVIVGVWDDYRELPAAARFIAQIAAALIMVFQGGIVLADLGELTLSGELLVLGALAVPFTIFACLGVINAMNMCDGLDGLSGSLALIALTGLGIADVLWHGGAYSALIGVFAACVGAFLVFNLRTMWRTRAWIFLGDAGSMFLGFALAWLLISSSQGADRVFSPAAALWFLLLPIYDAVSMMLRRLLRRQSPFAADREHLHHIFMLAGFSVSETVTLMCGIAIGGVAIGLIGTWLNVNEFWFAGGFLAGGMLYYWAVCRAWRVMRFLKRSICRRAGEERRGNAAAAGSTKPYAGPDRRMGSDRRTAAERRRSG